MTAVDHRKLPADLAAHPGGFGLDGSFHDFTTFICGWDAGTGWQLLAGFGEWLVGRLGYGDNLAWTALVRWLAFPDGPPKPADLRADPRLDGVAVETLFRVLGEFFTEARPRP